MKKFVFKFFMFLSPFVLIGLVILCLDVFKIYGFQEYYKSETFVTLNREAVTTSTLNNYHSDKKFDSFIFGNSKSQAFKCLSWGNYLPHGAVPFHFDASGDGIWGIERKINYVNKIGRHLKNVLIILDRKTLLRRAIRRGHLFIPRPEVSEENFVSFYYNMTKASLEPKFVVAYFDRKILGEYRGYMEGFLYVDEYKPVTDPKNCDIWYGNDVAIKEDSIGYYNELKKRGVFYKRPVDKSYELIVDSLEINLLLNIKAHLDSHNSNYKIVISPSYDQIPLEIEQKELLDKIFGGERVFDFSGANKYNSNISNFYENSHYRPAVADSILKNIYK